MARSWTVAGLSCALGAACAGVGGEMGAGVGSEDTVTAEVTSSDEVWERVWKEKPAGAEIPVALPEVELSDPAAQDVLDGWLSVEGLVGSPRAEIEDEGWIDRISWTSGWNDAGVLDLRIDVEGSAAYPDAFSRYFVIDLETGQRIDRSAFSNPDALLARLDAQLQERIAAKVAEDPDSAEMLGSPHVEALHLDAFRVTENGLVFPFAFDLPHIAAASAPDSDLLIPWEEVPEVVAEGPLLRAYQSR